MVRSLLSALVIAGAAIAVYARTASYGLFSDDFGWLVAATVFEPGRLVELDGRTHFYRPVIEAYFAVALATCGRAAACYHWLNIAIHVANGLLVAGVAGALSRTWAIGLIAGVLFAVGSTPVEAVVWVSAVCELLATFFFVLTVWLFRRAVVSDRAATYAAAFLSFLACLLSHESGTTLLPVLFVSLWLLAPLVPQRSSVGATSVARLAPRLAPFVAAWLAYGAIAWIINSHNYVVTDGHYGVGPHVVTNVINALTTMFIVPRSATLLVLVAALYAWAAIAAPPRVRFYAIWTIATLVPFAGFREGDLPSRYYYLSVAGFSGLLAELLWWTRSVIASRWRSAGQAVWAVVTIALTVRFGAFAVRNAHIGEDDAAPYVAYAATVRALYPTLPKGGSVEVPAPPPAIPEVHVSSLLQWEYGDAALRVSVLSDVGG